MQKENWLDHPVIPSIPGVTVEKLIIAVILILTVITRFYNLDARVMAHDEVNHVVPSYDFYQGKGYRYDPVTHGPFQFHAITLSYFLFGANDFSSRVPAALFGVAAVAFAMLAFRRYLGRIGALAAGLFFLISPFNMFYSRYTRNEVFIVFWGLGLLFSVLYYLETGEKKGLVLTTLFTAFHFIDKATSYIFTAEMLIFLAGLFVLRTLEMRWENASSRNRYLTALAGLCLSMALVFSALLLGRVPVAANAAVTPTPVTVEGGEATAQVTSLLSSLIPAAQVVVIIGLIAALACVVLVFLSLKNGLGWPALRRERSFDLLMLLITLVLPLLTALPVRLLGANPLDYSTQGILTSFVVLVLMTALGVFFGWWWKKTEWLTYAALFYIPFVLFYSTFFTYASGVGVGIMGALGYWMSQQTVVRGQQPQYYYALVQLPMYEYLAVFGTLAAAVIGIRRWLWFAQPGKPFKRPVDSPVHDPFITAVLSEGEKTEPAKAESPASLQPVPTLALLVFWSITSLLAFSLAGERMPWLADHIVMPMLLCAGWTVGYIAKSVNWADIKAQRIWASLGLAVVFVICLSMLSISLFGGNPPFAGKELAQLQSTANFILSLIGVIGSGAGLVILLQRTHPELFTRVLVLAFFAFLAVLTGRAALRASFINYDNPVEFLVYAHAARGPKDILAQVEEISYRTTGGKNIMVAHDNDGLYPYWWYFRDYPNNYWFTEVDRKLKDYAIVLVGQSELFPKADAVLGKEYYRFEYKRLWWPMEDYKDLTWERFLNAVTDPNQRAAIFDIWFNADYRRYAEVNQITTLTLETWQPSNPIRMYIRKDLAAQIWEYGVAPTPVIDPYAQGTIKIDPITVIGGMTADDPTMLQSPRGVAFAPDGTFYVADSRNHRIVHFDAAGKQLNAWGSLTPPSAVPEGSLPNPEVGTFNEPWGVAVGPDGSVYVADTWNNRIQKFTADGAFVKQWGKPGQAETPDSFWGPRGVAVDAQGRVYVTDTGNKRVVIFTSNGEFLSEFGGAGIEPGQLDEPVGIAVDASGNVYVADTWNGRIQVFAPDELRQVFTPVSQWPVEAWGSQGIDNKPFLAVDNAGNIFFTDPEAGRVIQFNSGGQFVRTWGEADKSGISLNMASGVAVDSNTGLVWVSDGVDNRLLAYPLQK
ncbi:MAG TPA: SMP-30/gluconolactonase/LRE family protein [Anaerolineaceae bacterium]|nr:SMP-30/gluconolactonase/LRE family protein [Anaerolineaceae bacterium]HPN51214.1 SMP-30/gluconolactonase/LRE family protein [Anaerolineaceae bacterium]